MAEIIISEISPQGQKSEAERYFLKAIELDPARGNCYMHYGRVPEDLSVSQN